MLVQATWFRILFGLRPYDVKNQFDVETVKNKLHHLAPVISMSCVTGKGLDTLLNLLFALPKLLQHQNEIDQPFEFLAENTFVITGVTLSFQAMSVRAIGQKVTRCSSVY